MTATVYLLECADGTYYCGWTVDMPKRLDAHNAGTASKYTRSRLPVALAYSEETPDKNSALSREHAIKRMTRKQKEYLVFGKAKNTQTNALKPSQAQHT
jgi:putative endonuclease